MSVYVTPQPLPYFVGDRDYRSQHAEAPPVAGIAFVQGATADTADTQPASLDVTLASPATAGNLIVVAANSDATLTGPAGFSTAESAVNFQGLYLFYKIATGGETALTVTPSVGRPVAIAAAEYSAITAVSPVDQTVSATANTSPTTGPVSAGTTGATGQSVELVLSAVGPHDFNPAAPPSSPSWSGGFISRGAAASALLTNTERNSAVFLAELVVGAAGTQTTSVTWTNTATDWGAVIVTFKGA